MPGLRFGVLDMVDGQVEFIVVTVNPPAELGAPVSENPQHYHAQFGKGRQHRVMEQVGRRDRGSDGVELGHHPLRVGVHKGLLVDA